MQDRVLGPALKAGGHFEPPAAMRLPDHVPLLRRVLGRALGLGLRPEHLRPR